MKKYLLSIVTLFSMCLLFSFTSCSKDDDDKTPEESGLIGKWVLVHEKYTDSTTPTTDFNYRVSDEVDVFIFKKNGTIRNYGYYTDSEGNKKLDFDISGEWELSKNKLIVYDQDGDKDECKIISLTKRELVLYLEYEEDNAYIESTYQKVD